VCFSSCYNHAASQPAIYRYRMTFRTAAVVLAVAGCALGLSAQQSGQQPEPTFRVQVDAVEIDAVVTDAQGNLITDLARDDFEILENGTPQTITSFGRVDIPLEKAVRPLLGPAAEPDVQSNNRGDGRLYVIALDEMAGEQALRTRRFLRRFFEQYFGANDLGAVVYLGRARHADSQDLTSNPRLLLKAVDAFTGGFSDAPMQTPETLPVRGATGSALPPPTNFERDFDLRRATQSLRQTVDFMAALHGRRKALLLFSQGYPNLDTFRVIDYRGGTLKIQEEDLHKAITAATRNNVTIYPIDPRGLTPDGGLAESETGPAADAAQRLEASLAGQDVRQGLRALADVTGGFALVNSNSFDAAFSRIVQENSRYYVLGFSSTNDRRDGRYRRLEVRVTKPGLTVRSRAGYMAPLRSDRPPAPPAPAGNVSAPVANALRSAIAVNGLPLRVFAAPFRGASRDATVVLAIELDGSQLGLVEKGGGYAGAAEVTFLASDSRNKIIPGRTQSANLTLTPDTYQRVVRYGIRTTDEMQLAPGRYQVRVAVGNKAGKSGSVVYDLEVPDFTSAPLVLSGVVVSSSSVARLMTLRPEQSLAGVLPGPVTAAREFAIGDTLTLFAEAYDNQKSSAAHAVELVAELREEGGRAVTRVEEQRSSAELKGRGGYGFAPRLGLEGLQAGLYIIHVEARSTGEGRPSVSRDIQIRVR